MANKKISQITEAAYPLAGTEEFVIVQSSSNRRVSTENITAGRAVSAAQYEATTTTDTGTPFAAFRVNRTLANGEGPSGHGFRDQTVFQRDGFAYAAFDAASKLSGGHDFDHHVSFQSRLEMDNSGGTLINLFGMFCEHNVAAGTLTNAVGLYLAENIGAGTITNQYGVYIEEMTKGGTLNYAIFTQGTTPSLFGGEVTMSSGKFNNAAGTYAAIATRTTSGAANAKGFTDNTVFANEGFGYASYDSTINIGDAASQDYSFAVNFQAASNYVSSGGTLASMSGLLSSHTVGVSCTVTALHGVEINDVANSGTVTTQYGVRVKSLTGGTTNWAVYTEGTTRSRFGGDVVLGQALYFGLTDVDGTWRIVISGDDLVFQQREAGSYVTKSTISGA